MFVEAGLVDANVLAYAANADVPQHESSRALLGEACDPLVTLYVTSQILCEFYSIVTNGRRVATPSSSAVAVQMISALLALPGIHVLPSPAATVPALVELLRRRPVTGGEVFDLQIVATMKVNGVRRIYTYNVRDFEVFPELVVVVPGVSFANL